MTKESAFEQMVVLHGNQAGKIFGRENFPAAGFCGFGLLKSARKLAESMAKDWFLQYDSMSPARYYAEAYGPGTKIFHGGKLYYVVGEDGKIHKP